jgi:hypothetical protein
LRRHMSRMCSSKSLLSFQVLMLMFIICRNVCRGDDTEARKKGIMEKVRGLHDGLTERVPQQHKDAANGHIERGKKFLIEEYFPEEHRDQFI